MSNKQMCPDRQRIMRADDMTRPVTRGRSIAAGWLPVVMREGLRGPCLIIRADAVIDSLSRGMEGRSWNDHPR